MGAADAEALPFADGELDVVTSSFGAIFAPDHQAVADELLRVCRVGVGPVVAVYRSLAGDPEPPAALDRDFLAFADRASSGPPDGPAEYRYEYLVVIARKRGRP